MEVLHWFVEATSVSGSGVYCAGMTESWAPWPRRITAIGE
jgi:hypothetical protein